MGRKSVINKDNEGQFLKDYEDLGTIKALIEKWGIHRATATKHLQRLGVDTNKRRDVSKGDYHPKLGVWSDRRIARDLGVTHQAVSAARERRGIESPYEKAMKALRGE
mgnify:CR=1 FL=1